MCVMSINELRADVVCINAWVMRLNQDFGFIGMVHEAFSAGYEISVYVRHPLSRKAIIDVKARTDREVAMIEKRLATLYGIEEKFKKSLGGY